MNLWQPFRLCALIAAVLSHYVTLAQCLSSSSSSAAPTKSVSVGELIQRAHSVSDLLVAADQLWLPTDEDLPRHLQTQLVHHEKRLRWSAQLLGKFGSLTVSTDNIPWDDARLERAVWAASLPFESSAHNDRPEKEGRYLKEALCGIHDMLGRSSQHASSLHTCPSSPVLQGLTLMFERAEQLAEHAPLADVVEMRFACRGIASRLLGAETEAFLPEIIRMDARTAQLPFDIIPSCVDWEETLPDAINRLQDEIPFRFDTIVTRTGASVQERRGTAWIAEEGIGALAYSGKLMQPNPISSVVRNIMAQVEDHVLTKDDRVSGAYPIPFFDCALCNHYPDGESACKFHTDPEHGTHWERLTCVLAAGEPRRFAFRPIPSLSTWDQWDPVHHNTEGGSSGDPNVPAVITLFPGDVVKMFGRCNDDFHHAVYAEQDDDGSAGGRVSLVLKRAIARGGQKGHGMAGQGRRSRRNNNHDGPKKQQRLSSQNSTASRRRRRRS